MSWLVASDLGFVDVASRTELGGPGWIGMFTGVRALDFDPWPHLSLLPPCEALVSCLSHSGLL